MQPLIHTWPLTALVRNHK